MTSAQKVNFNKRPVGSDLKSVSPYENTIDHPPGAAVAKHWFISLHTPEGWSPELRRSCLQMETSLLRDPRFRRLSVLPDYSLSVSVGG